jgi:hypothetical protein
MSKLRRANPGVRVVFYLDEETFQKTKLLLMNPATGKIPHGDLTRLAESLFRQWLSEQILGAQDAILNLEDQLNTLSPQ